MLLFNRSFPFLKNRIRCGDLTTLQNSQFKINATQNWNSMRQNISIHTQKTTEYSMTWWSHRKRLEFARLFFVIFDGVLLLFFSSTSFSLFSTFFWFLFRHSHKMRQMHWNDNYSTKTRLLSARHRHHVEMKSTKYYDLNGLNGRWKHTNTHWHLNQ